VANDNEVRRIKVGDDLYVLAMSGSSRGADQMRKQAAESMKRVRERDADNEEPDSGG
jgi:hypothetical protein